MIISDTDAYLTGQVISDPDLDPTILVTGRKLQIRIFFEKVSDLCGSKLESGSATPNPDP